MEPLAQSLELSPLQPAARAAAEQPSPACPCAPAPAQPLDLTGMSAPGDLGGVRLEEFTIDGICGVY